MQLSTGFLENNRFFIFKYFQRERNKAVGVKWGEVEDKATPILEIFKLRLTWRVVMLIKVVSTRTVIIHQIFHEISY